MRTDRALIFGEIWKGIQSIEDEKVKKDTVYAAVEYAFEGSIAHEEDLPTITKVMMAAFKDNIDKGVEKYTKQKNNDGGAPTKDMKTVVTEWNAAAEKYELAPIVSIKRSLQKKMKTVFDEYDADDVIAVINKLDIMPYLCGENDREWKMDFEWFLDHFEKIANNTYVDGKKRKEWLNDHWNEINDDTEQKFGHISVEDI